MDINYTKETTGRTNKDQLVLTSDVCRNNFYHINIPTRDSNRRSRVMPLAQRALHPQATTASYFYGLWSKFLENDALDRLANLAALQ